MLSTLLCADRVWDGVASQPIEEGFVVVKGGLVTAVGRQAELGSRFENAHRLLLPGTTVLPGLINGHVHLTFSASDRTVEDYLADAAAGPCVLTLRAVANLEAAARAGVTTVRDLGTLNNVALAVREAAAEGRILAPRVITSGEPITTTGGHCHWFSHQCDTVPEIRRAVRLQARAGVDLVKIFATGGNLTPRTNPFAPQFSDEEIHACVEEATRLDLPVAAHAHAPEGIRRAVAAGASTIEHCLFETADGIDYDPAVADMMAARGVAFCPTFGARMRRTAEHPHPASPALRRILSRLPQIVDALQKLIANDVPLLAGNDAGVPGRPFSGYPADVATMVGDAGLGLTPRQALVAATSAAARILGLDDTGTLVPGRRADILAVTGDPLADIHAITKARLVMIGGAPVALAAPAAAA
jgi:imidazolonepropionase-like amidohydrolase